MNEIDQLLDLAEQFFADGRIHLAQEIWEACLPLRPDDLKIQRQLAHAHLNQNRLSLALEALERLVQAHPADLLTRQLMGRTCLRLREPELAALHFKVILQALPDSVSAMSGLADVALAQGEVAQAQVWAEKILRQDPQSGLGHLAVANALEARGRPSEAWAYLDAWVKLQPHDASARYHRARACLKHGLTTEGWRDFACVYEAGIQPKPALSTPWWDGSPTDHLLVVGDQGLGDTLMLARFLPEASRQVARLTLACHPSLIDWLSAALPVPVIDVHRMHELVHSAHVPIAALPGLLHVADPYQTQAMQDMQQRLSQVPVRDPRTSVPFKVGLSLTCSSLHSTETYPQSRRSCDPAQLAPLARLPEAHCFHIQKDPFPAGAALWGERWHELGEELRDFVDTAAWVNTMDVVVTVDSVLAHVAGLLGKPTCLLLPYVSDWRWQLAPQTNPWYPSVTLYRQPRVGDWTSVFEAVAQDLSAT